MSASKELGIGEINAVLKAAVSDDVAKTFVLDAALPDGLQPKLVDVGLPAGMDAFVIDDVLSLAECEALVGSAEESGLTFWDTSRDDPRKDYRNADTVEVTHPVIAKAIWDRMETALPDRFKTVFIDPADPDHPRHQPDLEGKWQASNTNDKVLFARYAHGGHFSPHTDGYSIVDFNYRSMYTLLVYLNECEGSGGTRFYTNEQNGNLLPDEQGRFAGQAEHEIGVVQTKPGRALCFFHNIVHEGCAVDEGSVKYIIRSDLMYARAPPICNTPKDIEAFRIYQEADELSAQGRDMEAIKLYRRCIKLSPALAQVYSL